MSLHDLRAKRATACDLFVALAKKDDFKPETDQPEFDRLEAEIKGLDAAIERHLKAQELDAKTARPVAGQEPLAKAAAQPKNDPWENDKSLVFGGIIKMIAAGGNNIYAARQAAIDLYGERHDVTKALLAGSGPAGGFIVPPDFMTEVIPLLVAKAVVRRAGPLMIPMPRGTMKMSGQASSATAGYGSEVSQIPASQPGFRGIVATYKKLTGLVPISNDMMRYADPTIDGVVRDDLVKVLARREDLAFLLGDGTQDSPRGFLSFANGWVSANGGTVGVWSTTAASTLAVNGADPANSTGGNFVTSNATVSQATVNDELSRARGRLAAANVPAEKLAWFMNPRTAIFLRNLLTPLGTYAYKDEMSRGLLDGVPYYETTQIPVSYWDASGTNKDLSFVFLVDMSEDMILDSMQLELAVSREASFVDATGQTVSAFQNDMTLIRAVAEHDHQIRHDQSISVIQAVRWGA